jgi:hypothetical protein
VHNKVATPIEKLNADPSVTLNERVPYREAVGSLMYLSIGRLVYY